MILPDSGTGSPESSSVLGSETTKRDWCIFGSNFSPLTGSTLTRPCRPNTCCNWASMPLTPSCMVFRRTPSSLFFSASSVKREFTFVSTSATGRRSLQKLRIPKIFASSTSFLNLCLTLSVSARARLYLSYKHADQNYKLVSGAIFHTSVSQAEIYIMHYKVN